MLYRIVHTVRELCQTRFRTECLLDHPVRVATRLYATLCALAKHLFARARKCRDCVAEAKFNHLVDLVGNKLTPKVYELITYTQV